MVKVRKERSGGGEKDGEKGNGTTGKDGAKVVTLLLVVCLFLCS